MFSMCSELTPRARIPDTRIPQLMQPWCYLYYVLLFSVLYLYHMLSFITPHPFPKLLVLWRLCPSASLCYPCQRAFIWGVGLPPPLLSYLCIYVLLVYCVKFLLYCIVYILCIGNLSFRFFFGVSWPNLKHFQFNFTGNFSLNKTSRRN